MCSFFHSIRAYHIWELFNVIIFLSAKHKGSFIFLKVTVEFIGSCGIIKSSSCGFWISAACCKGAFIWILCLVINRVTTRFRRAFINTFLYILIRSIISFSTTHHCIRITDCIFWAIWVSQAVHKVTRLPIVSSSYPAFHAVIFTNGCLFTCITYEIRWSFRIWTPVTAALLIFA